MKKLLLFALIFTSSLAHGDTKLLEASERGDLGQVKKLIQKGHKINAANAAGETALINAANGGHLDLIKYLVSKGADTQQRDKAGHTALFYSISNNQEQITEFLLQKKTPIALGDLFEAAKIGSVKTIQLLLEKKPTLLNDKNNDGETVLFEAVRSSQSQIVEALLKNGADKNLKNKKGQLAVNLADPKSDKKIIELLSAK